MKLPEGLKNILNILLGKADSETQLDFKEELMNHRNLNLVTEQEGIEMMETLNKVKKEAKELEKKQISSISLEDGRVVTKERYEKEKKEIERKKIEKAAIQKNSIEQAKLHAEKVNANNRLKIDKKRILEEMQKEEMVESKTKDDIERDGKS